jgi:uncharacterized integral membrane protein (TIGR00697 family)
MIDNILLTIANLLQPYPCLLISLLNLVVCDFCVFFAKRTFGLPGLFGCIVIFGILCNVQVLYATSYEIVSMPTFLGGVTMSSSFLACDLINKYYGPQVASKSVLICFFMQIIFISIIILTIGHKPLDLTIYKGVISEDALENNIKSIKNIFIPMPRLLIASYIAYISSQMSEIWMFKIIEKKGSYIAHNVVLFLSSVIIDTLFFTCIALVWLTDDPLSFKNFWRIFYVSCVVRVFCNIINSFLLRVECAKRFQKIL